MSGLQFLSPKLNHVLAKLKGGSAEAVAAGVKEVFLDRTIDTRVIHHSLRSHFPNHHFPHGMNRKAVCGALAKLLSRDSAPESHDNPQGDEAGRRDSVKRWSKQLAESFESSDAFLQAVIIMMTDKALKAVDVEQVARAQKFITSEEIDKVKNDRSSLFSLMLDRWKKKFLADTEGGLTKDAREAGLMYGSSGRSVSMTKILLKRGS
jgi:hypothetical protein